MIMKLGHLLALLPLPVYAAKYEEYILAPTSRTLHPVYIHQINGSVSSAQSLTGDAPGSATFQGQSAVTYDFGKDVAGLVSVKIGNTDENEYIGLTYTESSLWISGKGCDATADAGIDEALWFHVTTPGTYTVERKHERGGFRYLSLLHNTTGNVEVQQITVQYTPMPHWKDDELRAYTGYFHCNDDLINRIWYAGAYTNQMCTIDPHHGDALVHLDVINSTEKGDMVGPDTWWLNFTVTNGSSCLVDGAKRDRLVWAGDMSIAVPSIALSTYDLISVQNSLNSLFAQQLPSGQLPYAGIPFPEIYSATYHLYTLIGIADYYLYSGDLDYLNSKWAQWKLGIEFSLSFIDKSGMMNVTSSADWLRYGMGGHNIEANSIFYYTINQGVMLGKVVGEDSHVLQNWTKQAEGVKSAANRLLWNSTAGMFHDNETTTLMPQDGNSWSVVSGLADSQEKFSRISAGLAARWTPYGAPAVEAADAVSPFISGFELQTHFLAGNASAALDLMRIEWGFMMNDPRMTNSTFIEGYLSDGQLHYPPYTNDPRISHAHGWSTGPTATLTSYVGGIHILDAGGKQWNISPALGDLTDVDTGFSTDLGAFSCQVSASTDGTISSLKFTTPFGTKGNVILPGVVGTLSSGNGTSVSLTNGRAENVSGGSWTLQAVKPVAANVGPTLSPSLLAVFASLVAFLLI